MNDMMSVIPTMKTGKELLASLAYLPDHNEEMRHRSNAERLVSLSSLYDIYIPSEMSAEIYSKLYLALVRSLQKKCSKQAIMQKNQNCQMATGYRGQGILGGADSFTIIGTSGIGKSSAIERALSLIVNANVIEIKTPYTKIIPCLTVQCPFDSSVKALLLEILRKTDEALGSTYFSNAVKSRITTDMLIGTVSQVALNHIGLLIVDEIQNVVNSKNGRSLVGMLTQLINNSGISICMVGTPECIPFFEQAMQLARRSLGLKYTSLPYDENFRRTVSVLYDYQYTKIPTVLSEAITAWLYEHSGGVISVVVSLIHDAQEIAILNGSERLDMESLREAYQKRLSMLHMYTKKDIKPKSGTREPQKTPPARPEQTVIEPFHLLETINFVKENGLDPIEYLENFITIEKVSV